MDAVDTADGVGLFEELFGGGDFDIKTVDANIDVRFRESYEAYFGVLKEHVPVERQGNFYSIGQDVLHNQMMAHLTRQDEGEYIELVEQLILKTYFCRIPETAVMRMIELMGDFFRELENYVLELLEEEKPQVFGLSVCSGTLAPSLFAFQLAKKTDPGIETIMGGGIFCDQFAVGTPNFELLLKETEGYLDTLIVGEGEILFSKYLKGELPKGQRYYSFQDISGAHLDITDVAIPDFSDFDVPQYPYLSAYTSRSCPYQCSFCSDTVMWGKYRKKKGSRIVTEMTRLYESHGARLFMMSDLLLNPVVEDLSKEMEKAERVLYWDGCLRAEKHVCDVDNTLRWRRGGFTGPGWVVKAVRPGFWR